MTLVELIQPVSRLPGVGPSRQKDLARLGILTVLDLLLHLPRGYEDRQRVVPFAEAAVDRPVNTTAQVIAHDFVGRPPNQTLKVHLRDRSGAATLVCFGRNFLSRQLPPGTAVRLYGSFARRYGELQATSFDFEPAGPEPESGPPGAPAPAARPSAGSRFGRIIPVYPLAGRLTQGDLRRATESAVSHYAQHIASELPPELRTRRSLLETGDALCAVHAPETLEHADLGMRTLRYLELFFLQIGIGRRAARRRLSTRPAVRLPDALGRQVGAGLPFQLTADQVRVIAEIVADLESDVPMARLLQGDVGSGKTVVALLSALPVIEAGRQVALMAPTELLARQHADSISNLLARSGADVQVACLSGSVPAATRKQLVSAIATGSVDLVVGTHAVFTEAVRFRNLQYVIIDEQHRFGVLQRLALMLKGREPDLLLMTATPIPRTLALTVFGDMQVSTIRTLPSGRKPIETHLARQDNERKVYEFVRRELAAGRQAYFVYPVIDESAELEIRDAQSMWRRLDTEIYPEHTVGLIHSRLADEDKRATMERFRSEEIRVLVATSVVEVGVDVPNATCMVVEHAERFGLAALHQLRGRVGRGEHRSYCFLVYDAELTDSGRERLKVLHGTNDGFVIAEEDLRIRGPGDIAGTQQAGYLRFRLADLGRDLELMNQARSDAFDLLESDPTLGHPDHRTLAAVLEAAARDHRATPFSYPDRLVPAEAP